MPPDQWRPLSRRNDPDYPGMHDGVPEWLESSLMDWIDRGLAVNTAYNIPMLLELERKIRTQLDWSSQYGLSAFRALQLRILADPVRFLDVVDYLLSKEPNPSRIRLLDQMLQEGGSTWKAVVRDGTPRLERRVDAIVASAAEAVMNSGRAGRHIERAWASAYGRNPDPSTAFREAVRAAEAAAQPVLSPRNAAATLGTMIADLENAPAHWDLKLTPPPAFDKMDALIKMVRLLWKSQFDRHGTPDDTVPLTVSQEEAETAIHVATTLVHWFTSGSVVTR